MTDQNTLWSELTDRLEALALKLKLHFEQSRDGEVPEAVGRLRQGVEDAFEAAGNAIKDDAVRADVREAGRLLADAVSTTLTRVADDLREAAHRKS
ncbi:MAG TPA: hypothetical protein VFC00_27115 [Micromonosporaceae bacterium]|nr:hypothetical protein [Micromonosporaceae bacterium]